MSKPSPVSEWLKIMLDEIDRKHDEATAAMDERDRRSKHDGGSGEDTQASKSPKPDLT